MKLFFATQCVLWLCSTAALQVRRLAPGEMSTSSATRMMSDATMVRRRRHEVMTDSVRRRRIASPTLPEPTKAPLPSRDVPEPGETSRPESQDFSPVPVDFYVFTSEGKRPIASSNIGGKDRVSGFYTLCKNKCTVRNKYSESCGCTSPEMEFCDCIAELLVEDLNSDFGKLMPAGSPRSFVLGQYKEVEVSEDLFDIPDGHKALHQLMKANESLSYYRQSGHLTVWVATHIDIGGKNRYLGGTTYLDQRLYHGNVGAGILFNAGESRETHLLSHETGHVVGFHHTAGPEANYVYKGCPDGPVKWKMTAGPSCEPNIMGSWYDGPYCCPWPNNPASFNASTPDVCLKNDLKRPRSPFCCGVGCEHKCPKERPEATFSTKEHGPVLSKIFGCWRGHQGTEAPSSYRGYAALMQDLSAGVALEAPWVCQDPATSSPYLEAGDSLGPPCFQVVP